MKSEAEAKFGRAEFRPQDVNKALKKDVIRTNLEIGTFPDGYRDDLYCFLENLAPPSHLQIGQFSQKSIIWVEDADQFSHFMDNMEYNNVLSLDFEFHQEDSYDGIKFTINTSLC